MIPSEINILVGLQWGSEGRESLIKFLAETSDVCVRFQGCANDGLTLTAAETDMEINYLPAGIAREGTTSLICGDCLIDLGPTVGEIKRALKSGLLKSVLTLDEHCHLIFDFHKKLEIIQKIKSGGNSDAGLYGAAAAMSDKCAGLWITASDLLSPAVFYQKLKRSLEMKNFLLERAYGSPPFDTDKKYHEYCALAETIKPYVGDAERRLNAAVKANLRIFFEGAGGAMRDVNRGTSPSPFRTLASAAFQTTAAKELLRSRVIGAAKAYVTRKGGGPLITEEKGAVAPFIKSRGGEGAGEISVGWLDLPALKYSLRENRVDTLVMTKLDALTGIDELKICTGYREGVGETDAGAVKPVYKIFDGWRDGLASCNNFYDLPREAQIYIRYIEDALETPVIWQGVGSTGFGGLNNFR